MKNMVIALSGIALACSPALAQTPPRESPAAAAPAPVPVVPSLSAPSLSAPSLSERVQAALAAAPAGTRFGLLVVDGRGRTLVEIDPDRRFIPASNTKLFTTVAAYALLPEIAAPTGTAGTGVALVGTAGGGAPDAVLVGFGDAYLSAAADCTDNCLSTLADVIAAKTRSVNDVIGDATYFPDQRWSPGMSWNNIGSDDGTAIAALSLADNVVTLEATPGYDGLPPRMQPPGYFALGNDAVTVVSGTTALAIGQSVGQRRLRLSGQMPLDARPLRLTIGIDDPAEWTAWNLAEMLTARGVRVAGKVQGRYRPAEVADARRQAAAAPFAAPPLLARLNPPSLASEVALVNKQSSNIHAELLLRRIGRLRGTGSLADGIGELQDLLARAGVPRAGYDFSDGSGMSTYNRVSPRAAVTLLRWAAGQPWGTGWRASLPVGGVDGTLRRRFAGTPLQGQLWAKTGTLNATSALSGYLRAASGQELTFAIFANDVPDGASALPAMDAALQAIAAAN